MLQGRKWHGDRLLLILKSAMGITNIIADLAQSLGVEPVFPVRIFTVWGTTLRMHL
jgi:hypothetical protein